MKKTRTTLKVSRIAMNSGQVAWLPKNPRQWTQEDVDKTKRSILEDEDFLEDRPLLVIPNGDKFCVFCGNLRLTGAKAAGLKEVPCVVYEGYDETPGGIETVKRRALKDNGSYGSWDWDIATSEWDAQMLADCGAPIPPDWADPEGMSLSTQGKDGEEGYDEFIDKFKPKLTTDDCYTPPKVYTAVLDFVRSFCDLSDKTIVRPFVPGGDFEHYAYPQNAVVVDNPPFSILSKIVRFFCEKDIPFFIFAPALTLFSAPDCDVSYVIADANIIYENGAKVRTGFITNLLPETRIWLSSDLHQAIEKAQEDEAEPYQLFVYPDNLVTAATLGKIVARDVELKIAKRSCEYIRESDSAKEQGRSLYGGGFLLSDRAAAERAAAERAAAERAAATRLNLSDKEKQIIERLNAAEV